MKPLPRALALSVMIAGSWNAQAVDYRQVHRDQSAVTFTYQQMGVTMEGAFGEWAADLRFDPDQPTAAQVTVDVDLAGIDTGSAEGDAEVAGKVWLNTPAFPTGRFVAKSVKPLGDHRYEVTGALTIKGRTHDITTPVSFTPNGKSGSFDGVFAIKRSDYGIGEGQWADVGIVADEIRIKFHIVAGQ